MGPQGLRARSDQASDDDVTDPFDGSDVFRLTESTEFKHWQTWTRDVLTGFVASTSYAATLPDADREVLLRDAGALYDSYDRGPDGLQMPWVTHCFRGRVSGLDPYDEPPPLSPRGPDDDETVVISLD